MHKHIMEKGRALETRQVIHSGMKALSNVAPRRGPEAQKGN